MRFIKILFFSMLLVSISLVSCTKNNEETLYGNAVCDTTKVKYSTDIVTILNGKCNSCHSKSSASSIGGGTVLDSYSQVSNYTDINGALIGSVKHDPNFSSMPKGGPKLTDCEINKIDRWVLNGAPNN